MVRRTPGETRRLSHDRLSRYIDRVDRAPCPQIAWGFYCERPRQRPVYEPREMLAFLLEVDEHFLFTSDDSAVLWAEDFRELWERNIRLLNSWVSLAAREHYVQQFDLRLAASIHPAAALAQRARPNHLALAKRLGQLTVELWPESSRYVDYWVKSEWSDGVAEIPIDRLVTDDRVVWTGSVDRLIGILAKEPMLAFDVHPRRFEEIVAEIFRRAGYQVELTNYSGDRGVDIVAVSMAKPLGINEKLLIQCKRYAPGRAVGIEIVQRLLGAGMAVDHTGLIIVTTSRFTRSAKEVAATGQNKWRLHLKDFRDLVAWLRSG